MSGWMMMVVLVAALAAGAWIATVDRDDWDR